MRTQHGRNTIGWMTAMIIVAGATATASEPLVVRMYGAGGNGEAMVAAARAAAALLRDAGVDGLSWRDCSTGCADAVRVGEVLVRFVHAPSTAPAGSLGCAVIDVERRTGMLVTIYGDRIKLVAERAGVDEGMLLGRAIAHEIGHLLLGTSRHTEAGLMRALWTDAELQRNSAADWRFLEPLHPERR